MNLVDLVTSQLTGDVLGKLAGLTGTNEAQTRSATNAAVPALLTAFAKLASTNSGANTLATSLGGLDLKTLGNLAGLLGGSQASGLFAGMQPGIMKTLLTYLAPIVLGAVANSFKGAKPDAAGLMRLFSEQQSNIKAALPRGLSLADFDTTSASPRRAEETRGAHRHDEPASAFPSWLPLLLLPLLGLVGWALWPKPAPAPRAVVVNETVRQEGPLVVDRTEAVEMEGKKVVADVVEETIALAPGMAEALKVGENLTGLFGNLGKVFGTVTDEASARAAIPQLNDYAPVLESLQKSTVALPEAGRSTIAELVVKNMGVLQKVIDTVMAIPGVKEILGPTVTPMIETLSKLGK
jgi:hypothetical protein